MENNFTKIINDKFAELKEPITNLSLSIFNLMKNKGIAVTYNDAVEWNKKITDLVSLTFKSGQDAQKQIDDIIFQELLNKLPNKESKK